LGGIKVPLTDLETTPESIKQVLKILLEERKETKQRIEELEERLNKNFLGAFGGPNSLLGFIS
ncbi:MAG: hypothetical protein ACK52Q_04390, partial [Pseudanabaena sp.]